MTTNYYPNKLCEFQAKRNNTKVVTRIQKICPRNLVYELLTGVPVPGLDIGYAKYPHYFVFESWDLKIGVQQLEQCILKRIKSPGIILSISMLLVGIFTMNRGWQTRRC